MWLSTVEIAPKSLFLCVNRSHIRYGFHAGAKAIRYGLKPSLACKIFDSMISPILTYNSEVWGAFVKSDFKSWDS